GAVDEGIFKSINRGKKLERERERRKERDNNGGSKGFNGDGGNADQSHLLYLFPCCYGSIIRSGSRSHQRWNINRPRDSICANVGGFAADIYHSLNFLCLIRSVWLKELIIHGMQERSPIPYVQSFCLCEQ
ncbi:hypothetical protein U1Q18_031739, partial [Sarracenia purpurea var. burkii]